jgi:hypothetical protein
MPLTDHQLVTIRSWVGTFNPPETDAFFEAAYDRIGSYDAVIVERLRFRIADLASQPQSLTVPGLSISHGVDIQTWEARLKWFTNGGGSGLDEDLTESTSMIGVSVIVRPDLR